jgi:hypothetical protein
LILLRSPLEEPFFEHLLQRQRFIKLKQFQDLISKFRLVLSRIKLLVSKPPIVVTNFSRLFTIADDRDIFQTLLRSSGVKLNAVYGRRKEIFPEFVRFKPGGNVAHVDGFDGK